MLTLVKHFGIILFEKCCMDLLFLLFIFLLCTPGQSLYIVGLTVRLLLSESYKNYWIKYLPCRWQKVVAEAVRQAFG